MDGFIDKARLLFEAAANNRYQGLIGTLLGIVGLVYAVYTYRKTRKHKHLDCSFTNANIISNRMSVFPKLDIMYDGKQLDNFTVTKMYVTNLGTEVVRKEDVARLDPLRISMQDAEQLVILDYASIYTTNRNNNISIDRISDKSVEFTFDYMEPKDSFAIQVLHTGQTAEAIAISGTVIGAKRPFKPLRIGDTTGIDKRFRNVVMRRPRIFGVVISLILSIAFGFVAYLLFPVSWIASIVCLVICLFFLRQSIRFATMRINPISEAYVHDMMRSTMSQVLSDMRLSERSSDKEVD